MRDIKIIKFCIKSTTRGGCMNQDALRKKLSEIIELGLSASSISKATNISRIDLSRFKNGQICLNSFNAKCLEKYLDKVCIPTSI